MCTQTIRRNSLKTIRFMLEQCVVVTCYKYDDGDMDTNTNKGTITAEEVIKAGESNGFDRVYTDSDRAGEWFKIVAGIHSNWFFTGYRTKEDAKRMMTPEAFAKYFPVEAEAERAAAEKAFIEECEAARLADAKRIETLTTAEPQSLFYAGQRIVATFASLNKNSSLGEYIRECEKPEEGTKYWHRNNWRASKNWSVNECKVDRVIKMTPAEYDCFAVSVMENRSELFDGFGGADSDYQIGREISDFRQMTEEEEKLWLASSYTVVAVIEAPGRKTIVVNPEGYSYARYVGLSPLPICKSGLQKKMIN